MWTLRLYVYAIDFVNMRTFSLSIGAGQDNASVHRITRQINARACSETTHDQRTLKAEFVSGVPTSQLAFLRAAANYELASKCHCGLDHNIWNVFGSVVHGPGVCRLGAVQYKWNVSHAC